MSDTLKNYPRTIYDGPGDEIVISGLSGRYPNALNLKELEDKLYNKVDLVDDDERRWRHEHPEIPKRSGKTNNLEKFDATFFGIHFKHAHSMDPQGRMLIEQAYEAVLDAGINPKSLQGTRTGVFIAACFNESEKVWLYDGVSDNEFGITGCSRAMLPNRISYTLGLQGPSFLIDTACSSSLYAIDAAFTAMRNGECDAALVGAANLLLHPTITLQFARLGVLSPTGWCRPFDADASGYVRAEAISVAMLQKSRDAKRIYATVVHSKTNCDGYKEEGITYPSGYMQKKLLTEFYTEINIKPETVDYIEAHGTGTLVGDPEECNALDEVFCKNRKTPMPIGSVKSNMGHCESAAGLCSIAKCILAMENQLIPPNINFSKIRPSIKALVENRLQVVDNARKLDGPLLAINSFGFGGANAHCLLKAHSKLKIRNGAPIDSIPRLVKWSGRTEEACSVIHETLASQPLDIEYIALLHSTQTESTSGHVFKSYGLFKHTPNDNAECLTKEIQHFSGIKCPIVYVYSGMGSQWNGMGTDLLELPVFRKTIQKCHDLLKPKGLDLLNIITSPDKTVFDNILHSFVGIASIQAALTDCLIALNIKPDYIIGHSVGELGCAYADNCLTLEQMIFCAYARGMASLETKTIKGSMAAVGQSYNQIKNIVPPTIDVACHNGPDSCTLSGPEDEIKQFVAQLTTRGIFARAVAVSNIAYHSRYIAKMGPNLLRYLVDIIKEPKKRSAKWFSTSVPKNKWNLPETQYCSAQYQTNNLLSPVLFEESSSLLPSNAILIEIAPHGLLQAILRKSFPKAISIPLTQRGNKQNLDHFLTALGRIYINGVDMAVENLYPKVEFPVSRGTARISHLIKWDHSEDWFVMKHAAHKAKSGEKLIEIAHQDQTYKYIMGHVVDGRCLFPATGYLSLVWETFAGVRGGKQFSQISVQFEDVKYLRATTISEQASTEFLVAIQIGTGRFEITEGTITVVTGHVKELPSDIKLKKLTTTKNDFPYLPPKDLYKELRLRGYHYTGLFRDVIEARSDGLHGKVRWQSNWVSFMDCLIQISILTKDTRGLLVPTGIDKLTIDTTRHHETLNEFDPKKPESHFFDVLVDKERKIIQSGGIEIHGLHSSPIGRRKMLSMPVLESYKFIPYWPTPKMSEENAARICVQHALENHPTLKIKCVEILSNNDVPFITKVKGAIEDLPLVTGELTILSSEKIEYENIQVESGNIESQSNCLFIIKSKCLTEPEFIERTKSILVPHGYIISRETSNLKHNKILVPLGFRLIAVISLNSETLVMLQKKITETSAVPISIKISLHDTQLEWLEQLQTAIKKNAVLILYSQNEPISGVIGLVNCIRKEPNRTNVKCVFIDDSTAPPFDTTNSFYKNQLDLNLTVNIYQNGKWGTYRHLVLDKPVRHCAADEHAYANITQRGDLSSIRWLNGPFSKKFANQQIKIHFAALNFRDVMLATGRLAVEIFGDSRLDQECVLGLEYSGVDCMGNQVMGMAKSGALGTHIISDPGLMLRCPTNWSLKEAATVPIVYGTVYASLFLHANITRGQSILIHAGTGGVGLAAIRVAFANGLNVFTTVSTKEKRKFLLDQFPLLKDSHIGNSRDLSFEEMIHCETKGRGVDYVLNSLSEEKLEASLRCLGKGGKFLEIGKFDMANNTKIGLRQFLNEISFQAVLLDNLFDAPLEAKTRLRDILQRDIDAGIIKPLPATVYPASEIEAAFRFLASGKHMGKVLLKIRENPTDNVSLPIEIYPRFTCEAKASYIVVGGLGGFGLELIDWLVIRGARQVIISSSRGISKPYQSYRIKIWESYGATIKITSSNVTTENGCEMILKEASKLGPVAGIFNLAASLQDGIIENLTVEKFNQCCLPKANATVHLDQLSRKLCPELKYFVVFSSISCGRGNAGQSNYGMANSIMERIIEQRHKQNLPSKAIQWGAVGEVGLVADMQEDKNETMEIGGTLQQRITSCLEELDNLLLCDDPVVASMVVAEKNANSGNKDVISSIMNIMSIRDVKSISMNAKLAELGMDSLMAVEINQTLERDFDIVLSAQDLRKITMSQLHELNEQKKDPCSDVSSSSSSTVNESGFQMLFQGIGEEIAYDKSVIRLPSRNNSTDFKTALLIIPGIEGVLRPQWNNIVSSIDLPTFYVQMTYIPHAKTIEEIVNAIAADVYEEFAKNLDTFHIIGYSFGSVLALHLATKFETSGIKGNVVLFDGSIAFLKKLMLTTLPDTSENTIELAVCSGILKYIFPEINNGNYEEETFAVLPTWEEKINKLLQYSDSQTVYSKEYLRRIMEGICNRYKMVPIFQISDIPKVKSPILLIRPTEASVLDIDEDYELRKCTESEVIVQFVEGNHLTMIDNHKILALLNNFQS